MRVRTIDWATLNFKSDPDGTRSSALTTLNGNDLGNKHGLRAAGAQFNAVGSANLATEADAALRQVTSAWPGLPVHLRRLILALVKG